MTTLDLLKKLVDIPSVFPNENKLAHFTAEYLRRLGFEVSFVKSASNRLNLVGRFGESKSYLGFYGHLDTVEPDKNYAQNPYSVRVAKDKAYGLGVADMKGGVAAILKMAEYASQNNLPVKVIFGVDEENISQGAHDLVDSKLLDDVNFLIVGESGQVKNLKAPFSVVFGRKGRTLFDIEVFGKKSHAAETTGINAIEQAAKLISELQKIKFPADKNQGNSKIVFQEISSQTNSFSLPDYCLIRCSLLNTPQVRGIDFIDTVTRLAGRMGIEVKVSAHPRATPYGESYSIDTKNQFLKLIIKNILTPKKVTPFYTTSVADENIFANRLKIPVLSLGPTGADNHIAGEWVSIKSLSEVEQAYISILKLFHN